MAHKQRLSQAKLQRALGALKPLIAAVHDARTRYQDCVHLRTRHLSGLSRLLKALIALPASTDYSPYEAELKRRLIKVQHRVHGMNYLPHAISYALVEDLPVVYRDAVWAYADQAQVLLQSLADVVAHRYAPEPGFTVGKRAV